MALNNKSLIKKIVERKKIMCSFGGKKKKKNLNENRLKMLNKILEHHMARVNALTHEVYAYIYIYIYIYIEY